MASYHPVYLWRQTSCVQRGSIRNFLHSVYPYTGRQQSSLTGSLPHGNNSCQLQLIPLDLYDLLLVSVLLSAAALVFPWVLTTALGSLSLYSG